MNLEFFEFYVPITGIEFLSHRSKRISHKKSSSLASMGLVTSLAR